MAKIILVEDEHEQAMFAYRTLKDLGHTVHLAETVANGIKLIRKHKPDIVITDLMLGDETGLDVISAARQVDPLPDVLMMTAHPTAVTASEALRRGAYDYISKPYSREELGDRVRRMVERRQLLDQHRTPVKQVEDRLIAESPAMKALLVQVEGALKRNTTLLIRGPSGAGKEQVARYIHAHGASPQAPFVAINCAALPENLLASELFGHEKGAFTGADSQRKGAFERAGEGTLLLDEIGDISLSTQVHLLRALESREIMRVGGDQLIPIQARVLCATHRDLEAMVAREQFRQDLYFRINVFPVAIAPLKDRPKDVEALTLKFLADFDAPAQLLDTACLDALKVYRWPGNVRELRNVIENLVIRSFNERVNVAMVNSLLIPLSMPEDDTLEDETLEEMEARRIKEALAQAGGNKSKAAALLGITRRKLYSRFKVLEIEDEV
ncbi:MAG: two-component system response regulator HydG [Kiritimatiellia bacterium]|jgi:two-component system response regulator HydG